MRTRSKIPTFGVDLLQNLPWTDVGEQVAEGEDFDQLSIECVNYGRIVAEPGHVVHGFLLRFDAELDAALHENGQIADRHAGAIYWTDKLDMPEIVNHVYLLSNEEIDLIELQQPEPAAREATQRTHGRVRVGASRRQPRAGTAQPAAGT